MVITSSGGKNKKWTIAIIAIFLLLSLAAGVLYFVSRKIDLQKNEVSQESLDTQSASYTYVMKQDGTYDKERVGIDMISTGEIRQMFLEDEASGKEVGEVYVLKGYIYDVSGKKRDLEIIVQAIDSETGENYYKVALNTIIQEKRIDISTLDVLSTSQLEEIFPSGSNWRILTSIVGYDTTKSEELDGFLSFVKALGGKEYYLSISRYINSGLKTNLNNIVMPEAIIPNEQLPL